MNGFTVNLPMNSSIFFLGFTPRLSREYFQVFLQEAHKKTCWGSVKKIPGISPNIPSDIHSQVLLKISGGILLEVSFRNSSCDSFWNFFERYLYLQKLSRSFRYFFKTLSMEFFSNSQGLHSKFFAAFLQEFFVKILQLFLLKHFFWKYLEIFLINAWRIVSRNPLKTSEDTFGNSKK